jgi:hypothetical protein
LHTENNLK